MPEVYRLMAFDSGLEVLVWRADGSERHLLSKQDVSWQVQPLGRSALKQQEREAARCAAVALIRPERSAVRLCKAPSGQPMLCGDVRHISLTHSKGWGAAALAHHPTGIDLEWIDKNRSLEPASKFLNEHELYLLNHANVPILAYFLFWSIKECIYKVINNQLDESLSFQQHFDVQPRFDPSAQVEGVADVAVRHPGLVWRGQWNALRMGGFWLTWGRMRQ
jgi:phosphopantetheinyl transferase